MLVHFWAERERDREKEKREGEKEKRKKKRKGGKTQHFQWDVSQVPQSHYVKNQLEISPCLPQLGKAHTQQGRPSTVKKKKKLKINLKKYCNVGISAYDTEKYMCIAMYEIPDEHVK